jgi:hypothetical protein
MKTWVQAGDDQTEERLEPGSEGESGEVVDFPAKRLRDWLRGTFGGERKPAAEPPSEDDR